MPVAIVTGSDSGIGKATAIALAERGMDIGITWHSDQDGYYFNDLVTFDLNTLSSPQARWELVQAVTDPPSARTGHVCLSLGDRLIMYVLSSDFG